MKLPWVPRDTYALALAQLAEQQRRYDDLLARYHTLRLQGAAPPVVLPVAAPVDPVRQAIYDAAGADPELLALMLAQAETDRAAGVREADIVAAIRLGQPMTAGAIL